MLLVHIGDQRAEQSYRRSGIRLPSSRMRAGPRGVFAMPVLKDYFSSHQWLREMKRRGVRTFVGVYFRIPDREAVVLGHYGQAHVPMSAARAARLVMEAVDPRGYEVVVPRAILANEIHAIRPVNRVVGWRYYPGAKGRKPCGCPACAKGEIKAKRLRDAYEAAFQKAAGGRTRVSGLLRQ